MASSSTSTSSHDHPEAPVRKKLRSSDPDLTIVLRWEPLTMPKIWTIDPANCQVITKKEKEYLFNGRALASMSKFVDVALSTSMQEQQTGTTAVIVFEDIDPETFDMGMKLLEDPIAIRKMNYEDAMKVLPMYGKYKFQAGLQLCDVMIYEKMEQLVDDVAKYDSVDFSCKLGLDDIVYVIAVAFSYDSLTKSQAYAASWVNLVFHESGDDVFRPAIFDVDHLAQLRPLFQNKGFIKDIETALGCPPLTDEEIGSSLFPKYLFGLIRNL